VTAIGVLVGVVAAKDGDNRLLLAIPLVSLLVVALHGAASYRIGLIGNYIRIELWPYLGGHFDKPPPSWEATVMEGRAFGKAMPKTLLVDLPPFVILIAASVAALAIVFAPCNPLWWVGVGLLLAMLVTPIGLNFLILGHGKSLATKRRRESESAA
jgi:hypothetical protein